jgi:hypothetical protein
MRARTNVSGICSLQGESGVLCIGKAADFDSAMRRFESSRPSQAD